LTIILIYSEIVPRLITSGTFMYVCLCNGITERAVREAAANGARNLSDLQTMTGCASTCGSCADAAMQVLRDARVEQRFPLPLYSVAA
jgi:bacterioferritin-associated ferredoxin